MKPYAIYLLERFTAAEAGEQLSVKEQIPIGGIRMRLAADAEFGAEDRLSHKLAA